MAVLTWIPFPARARRAERGVNPAAEPVYGEDFRNRVLALREEAPPASQACWDEVEIWFGIMSRKVGSPRSAALAVTAVTQRWFSSALRTSSMAEAGPQFASGRLKATCFFAPAACAASSSSTAHKAWLGCSNVFVSGVAQPARAIKVSTLPQAREKDGRGG